MNSSLLSLVLMLATTTPEPLLTIVLIDARIHYRSRCGSMTPTRTMLFWCILLDEKLHEQASHMSIQPESSRFIISRQQSCGHMSSCDGSTLGVSEYPNYSSSQSGNHSQRFTRWMYLPLELRNISDHFSPSCLLRSLALVETPDKSAKFLQYDTYKIVYILVMTQTRQSSDE